MKTAPEGIIKVLKTGLRLFLTLFYRVKYEGLENIPDKGRVLICPIHVTSMDMFFIGAKLKRLIRWMAKVELWDNKIVGFIIERLGAFPVKRGKGDTGAVKTAIELLEAEEALGLFPEGQRRKSSKAKGYKIHSGSGMLAVKTQSPIVPIGIDGSAKLFGKVRVVIGKPFYIEADKNKNYSYQEYVEFSKIVMKKAYSLIGKESFDTDN